MLVEISALNISRKGFVDIDLVAARLYSAFLCGGPQSKLDFEFARVASRGLLHLSTLHGNRREGDVCFNLSAESITLSLSPWACI